MDIQVELERYCQKVTIEKQGSYDFITCENNSKELEAIVQLKDSEPLAVYFLNNQFYDLKPSVLRLIALAIVQGKYNIETENKMHVIVLVEGEKYTPERITSENKYTEIYQTLPRSFKN